VVRDLGAPVVCQEVGQPVGHLIALQLNKSVYSTTEDSLDVHGAPADRVRPVGAAVEAFRADRRISAMLHRSMLVLCTGACLTSEPSKRVRVTVARGRFPSEGFTQS
jgi:hypothetical protein